MIVSTEQSSCFNWLNDRCLNKDPKGQTNCLCAKKAQTPAKPPKGSTFCPTGNRNLYPFPGWANPDTDD